MTAHSKRREKMANQIPLGNAVDLQREMNNKEKHAQMVMAQQMQQEANRRNSIYSLAASIVRENSEDVVGIGIDHIDIREVSETLAERSLILAHEFFKQVETFDKNLTETQKKEREKDGKSNSEESSGDRAGSVSPIITS